MPSQIMPTVNLMKLPDPAAQTAKYVNMMNATKQQEAAERQATIAQQRLDLETQEGQRQEKTLESNTRKADLEHKIETAKRLRNLGVTVYRTKDPTRREAAYQSWLGMVDKADSEAASLIRQATDTYDADIMLSLLMETDKFIDANVPKATYSNEYAGKGGVDAQGRPVPEGTLLQVRNSLTPEVTPITSPTAARAPTPVPTAAPPQTTPGPIPVGKFGETKVAPDGGQLDAFQQDHVRRMKEGLGMTDTPASFTRGGMATPTAGQMSPDMVPAIIDSAVKTGVMAQIDLDQMLALAPPQARQGIMDVIRTNNISLQADAPSLAASGIGQQPMAPNPVQRPQSQFADMRGPTPQASFADLGGQPQMQNTMAQYQPVQRRDPDFSPIPGSSRVPLSRVGAEKTTEAQAAANVNLKMNPVIAAETKKVENAAALKSEAPKIKYATEGVLDEVVDRINTIDDLLRNPNRFSIIGPIEGNLPRLLQYGPRADAQAAFDKIKNTATLTSLIDMRKSTETGASPVGANPTDRDAKIVEQAASKLIQTGEPAKFDAELLDMRRKLYRTYLSAQRAYDGVYGSVIKENPNLRLAVPKVSDRYISTTGSGKKGTSTKVDYNNPLLKGMKR
jgi:hypothetical protein